MCDIAAVNDVKTLRVMVKNGVDPSLGDYDMRTPLHLVGSYPYYPVLLTPITLCFSPWYPMLLTPITLCFLPWYPVLLTLSNLYCLHIVP